MCLDLPYLYYLSSLLLIVAVLTQVGFMYTNKYKTTLFGYDESCWKSCAVFILIFSLWVLVDFSIMTYYIHHIFATMKK